MADDARRLAERLARLEDDVRALQLAGRLGYSSVEGGATAVYDDDDTLRQVVGLQDDGTYTTRDWNAPASVAPAAPSVEVRPGFVIVTSFGLTSDGSDWPLDFKRIDVHIGTSDGFTPTAATKVAEFTDDGGSATVALDAGTYYVALVSVNTSLTPSAPSEDVEAVVSAPTTENGVVTYHTNEAPIGLGVEDEGSLWYDTDNGNAVSRWDGTTWIPMLFGGSALTADAIDGKTITGAILRTDDAGARIEMWHDPLSATGFIDLHTGAAEEALPGKITYRDQPSGLGDGTTELSLSLHSPRLTADDLSQASLFLSAQNYFDPLVVETWCAIFADHFQVSATEIALGEGRHFKGFDHGFDTVTTDANGYATIAHNLSQRPSAVSLTVASHFATPMFVLWDEAGSTASNIRLRLLNDAGVPLNTASRDISWIAIRSAT